MHYKKLFEPGDYLFAADLIDDATGKATTPTLTIAKVEQGHLPIQGTSRTERKPVISFAGAKKKLATNKTNCKTIAALYGNDTREWVGKRIALYATTCNGIQGGVVECIRVRPQVPPPVQAGKATAPQPAPQAAPATPQGPWEDPGYIPPGE